MPDSLDAFGRFVWSDLLKLMPPAFINRSDSVLFEALVYHVRKLRCLTATAADLRALQALLGRFGLSPQGRAQLAAPSGDRQSADDLMKEFTPY